MQTIIPNLWFNGKVQEAADFYVETFSNSRVERIDHYTDAGKEIHGHNAGDILTANIIIEGFEFILLNGGPVFAINPSISFTVNCATSEEVDRLWQKLSKGGEVLMELQKYPFSEHYGWLNDQFGVSWQLILAPEKQAQKIIPSLMYTHEQAGKAEEAINFYASVFPDSHVDAVSRYPAGMEPEAEGTVSHAEFTVLGQPFIAMDSAQAHKFKFNGGVSLMVTVQTQEEIDEYWEKLSAVPEAEACGWLADKYGVSWQITPQALDDMMKNGSPEQVERVTTAFMKMKKFDIAALQAAYGQPA